MTKQKSPNLKQLRPHKSISQPVNPEVNTIKNHITINTYNVGPPR